MDRKEELNGETFQETVIFLEVWEELEASGFHLQFQVKCEHDYQ